MSGVCRVTDFRKGCFRMKHERRVQKSLGILLCLLMLFSLMTPLAALAEDGDHVHKWIDVEVTVTPTCSTTGEKKCVCDVCGEEKLFPLPEDLSNHVHTVEVGAQESTCTSRGYTAGIQCTDCGNFISGHLIQPYLPHSFTNYTYNNDGKCEVAGTKTAYCDYGCGAKETIVAEGTAKTHQWSDWTVVKEETCTAAGMERRVCALDDSHIQTREIPATGHIDENDDGVCDVCYEKLTAYRCPLCNKYEAIDRSGKSGFVKFFYRTIHFVVHTTLGLFWG